MKTIENAADQRTPNQQESWLGSVREQVGSIRFGVVQIVVHEGRVVQIEKTEKIRFDKSEAANQRRPNQLEA